MVNYIDFNKLTEKEQQEFLESTEKMKVVFTMLPPQISMFIKSLTIEQQKYIVNYVDEIVNLSQVQFMTLLNSLDVSITKELFDDARMITYLMNLPKNKIGNHPFKFLDEEAKLKILNNHKLVLENPSYLVQVDVLEKDSQIKYFSELNKFIKENDDATIKNSTNEVITNLYNIHHSNDKEQIKSWYLDRFNINKNSLCGQLFNLIPHGQANLAYALTLKNEKEWLLYLKFGFNFPNLEKAEEKLGIILNKEVLEAVSARDMKHIYKEIREKYNEKDEYESLVLAINLYSIFGLDNSLKIVKGNFSKLNDKVLETAAINEFTNNRREYRVSHQEYFYSYELLQTVSKCLDEEKYEQLGHIFQMNEDEIQKFVQEVFKLWKEKKNEENWNLFLAHIIKDAIKEREMKIQKNYIKTYKEKQEQKQVDLFKYFKDIDLTKVEFDQKGRPIVKKELTEFLLGNEKHDNDCVLRMVLNDVAVGLNRTLPAVINNFDMIYHMIQKSNGKMNIHSLLDVVDASKVLLYDLKPDEQDISLETIAKIQNSRQHCIESPAEIIKKVKKLHLMRKSKVSSTIPIVKGKSSKGLSYEILNFNDERLFTTGIDTGSCFKVGAPGGKFLEYCLTDKNATVLTITGEAGKYYVCPIIRNGNAIFGNGIDPKPETTEEMEKVIETIKEAYERISSKSISDETIEMGIITDLHCKSYFSKQNLGKFGVKKPFIISKDYIYCDYFKPEITNYILYKSKENVKMDCYDPTILYYQPRPEPFSYISSMEKSKESVNLIINSIGYTLHRLDKAQKNKKYKYISVDDFTSIIGNKDWFVGFKKDLSLVSCCLPYDQRARQEMYKALSQVEVNVKFQQDMEGIKKCNNIKV